MGAFLVCWRVRVVSCEEHLEVFYPPSKEIPGNLRYNAFSNNARGVMEKEGYNSSVDFGSYNPQVGEQLILFNI